MREAPEEVFPAYAGVFPCSGHVRRACCGLPRIRGGVSERLGLHTAPLWSSPHTRGCFRCMALRYAVKSVFPAYAGVFLCLKRRRALSKGLPRIRGGVSPLCDFGGAPNGSSPHTRGCFERRGQADWHMGVFPAYAGVFPACSGRSGSGLCLPRIRGGVSSVSCRT